MRRCIAVAAGFLLITFVAWAEGVLTNENRQGITAAALGYMDGAFDGDAERVARAVHTELTKVAPITLPQTGRVALVKMGHSRLVEFVRSGVTLLEKEKRGTDVDIYDAREGIASARVLSSKYYDYLHLARLDGEWKIINVLWVPNDPAPEGAPDPAVRAKDEEGIRGAALDYLEGYFTGDAARMERALHSELTKVRPSATPETGRISLDKIGANLLIEATRTQGGLLAEEKRDIEITIYDIRGDIASAGAMSAMFYDYLQLAKTDGRWRIVNVLWTRNPNAPVPKK